MVAVSGVCANTPQAKSKTQEARSLSIARSPQRTAEGLLLPSVVEAVRSFARGAIMETMQNILPVLCFIAGFGLAWLLGGRIPGLVRFDLRDGRVTHYTKKDGLFDYYTTRALPTMTAISGSVPRTASTWRRAWIWMVSATAASPWCARCATTPRTA